MVKREITPPLNATDAKAMADHLDQVVRNFRGQFEELESALGMYFMGRHVGWRVLYLMHTKRTVAKYEAILGIKVSEAFDEVGPQANRSFAFIAAQKLSNFWKVVSGEQKLDLDREERKALK